MLRCQDRVNIGAPTHFWVHHRGCASRGCRERNTVGACTTHYRCDCSVDVRCGCRTGSRAGNNGKPGVDAPATSAGRGGHHHVHSSTPSAHLGSGDHCAGLCRARADRLSCGADLHLCGRESVHPGHPRRHMHGAAPPPPSDRQPRSPPHTSPVVHARRTRSAHAPREVSPHHRPASRGGCSVDPTAGRSRRTWRTRRCRALQPIACAAAPGPQIEDPSCSSG